MFYLVESRITLVFLLMMLYTFSKVRFSKKIMAVLTVFIFALTSVMDYFVYISENKLLIILTVLKAILVFLYCFIVSRYQDFRGAFMAIFAPAVALGGSSIAILWYNATEAVLASTLILIFVDVVIYGVMFLSTRKYVLKELEDNDHNWMLLCVLPVIYMVAILLLVLLPDNELSGHRYYLGVLFVNFFAFFVYEIIVRAFVRTEMVYVEHSEKQRFGTTLNRNSQKREEKKLEKKSLGIYGIGLIVSAIVLIGTFIALYVKNYQSNINGTTLPLSEVFSEDADKDVIMVSMEQRRGKSDTWTKGINLGKPGYYELQAYTYDMVVTNRSESQIEEWGFEFVAPQDMYINKAWCGTVEIHQSSEYETLVEELDLRDVKIDEVKLDHVEDDSDLIIPLKKGNKVIYHPNPTVYEYPITASSPATNEYNNVKIGFIFYYDDGVKPLPIVDGKFSYKINYIFWDQPSTKVLMFVGFIWIIAFMFYLGFKMRRKSYELKLEKDREMIHEVMDVFTGFVDAKDTYTAGHSDRVAIYSRLIAERMGYSEEEAWQVYYAGQLHDCGKVGIPESILNKPGKLTAEEFGVIKSHTTSGYEMLKNLDTIPTAAVVAKYHHERYDGTGYPEGLKGEEIPEIARIACVADSFDAMNSSRVYRPRLERSYIISQLEQGRGSQFDPKIVDLFLELLEDGSVDNAYGDEYFKNMCADILS